MLMGALQGLLLFAALLWRKPRRSPANRILAALMLLTAVRLGHVAFIRLQPAPVAWDWSLPLIFTFSPLLYLYCRALLAPRSARKRGDLAHFAPALIWAGWRTVLAVGHRSPAGPSEASGAWLVAYLPDLVWLIQTAAYLLLIRGLLRRHAKESPAELSDVESVRLTWIRALAAAFAFLCGLILVFLAGTALGLDFVRPSNAVLYISVALIVYLWGWFGLRQPGIFSMPAGPGPKAAGTAAAPSPNAAEGMARLIRVVDERGLHLDPALTLHDLARATGLPAYQVTALLNGSLRKTFYEFINSRRIEEAKRKLADPAFDNVKILAIALDCGFASKSAFNRVFLDLTGQTPSAYRKSLRPPASAV
jgi:AraC-like DNA-binding protein